ncbi:hypothetical protein Tco_0206992 [Tanacetum coccineum]
MVRRFNSIITNGTRHILNVNTSTRNVEPVVSSPIFGKGILIDTPNGAEATENITATLQIFNSISQPNRHDSDRTKQNQLIQQSNCLLDTPSRNSTKSGPKLVSPILELTVTSPLSDVHKKLCSYNLPSGSTMPWVLALSSRILMSARPCGLEVLTRLRLFVMQQLGFKSTIMGQYGIGSAQVAYGSVSKGNGSGSARNSSGFKLEQEGSILFGLPGSRQQKFLVLRFFDVKEQQGIDRINKGSENKSKTCRGCKEFMEYMMKKRVWFEVELQGAQGDREAEVFQVSNDDTAVAQRRLEDKQPEEKTNTDCLVKEQEKEYQTGWKIKTGNVLDSCNQRSTQQFWSVQGSLGRGYNHVYISSEQGIVGNKLWRLDDVTSKVVLYRNMGFNESGEYKKTFIGSGVGTGSMQVLQGDEFEVEPQEDHTFEVEPHRNVDHVVGSQEVQTQDLMDYQLARDREQHLACELFGYREDSNEAAFAVAAVEKIYAHESLTFNDTVACEVISKWKAGLKDLMVPGTVDRRKKNGKWSCIYAVGSQEYQMVCTRLDIASADVDQSQAAYMTLTGAWKKEIWLKGPLAESGYELSLVAGIATGALVKGGSRSEVPAQVEVLRIDGTQQCPNQNKQFCFQDVFKTALPPVPAAGADAQALADWAVLFYHHHEVACLMLGTMSLKLYQQFEHNSPLEIVTELQKMYGKPPGVERQELVNMFHSCKQAEGQSVSDHVILMKSYRDQLATLNYAFPDKVSISFILNSLSSEFQDFVQNYNMQSMEKTISEVHSLLIEFEKSIKRNKQPIVGASSTPQVMAIQGGRV